MSGIEIILVILVVLLGLDLIAFVTILSIITKRTLGETRDKNETEQKEND